MLVLLPRERWLQFWYLAFLFRSLYGTDGQTDRWASRVLRPTAQQCKQDVKTRFVRAYRIRRFVDYLYDTVLECCIHSAPNERHWKLCKEERKNTIKQQGVWISRARNSTCHLSKAHETRDSLSSSCSQIVLVYLQPFRRNSPLKCAPQPKVAKNTKNHAFGGSRSFKVSNVDKSKKPDTSACYDKQYVYTYLQPFSH